MNNNHRNLSEWVENYTEDLYRWTLHKVSDGELANDLVQDTFLAAAEKIDSFQGESSPKTWLFSILNHKIIDYYRKKVRQPVKLDNEVISSFFDEHGGWKKDRLPGNWSTDEEHLLDNPDFQKIMESCLGALPEKWNLCVKMKYLLEKKGDDICQELNISSTNFWQIIHRAKLQMRICIEDNWFKN